MKKYIVLSLAILFGIAGLFIFQYAKFNDGKLHIVFCNVGQGDAILIRTPSQKYILVDAGSDRKVLDCLAKHMPIWHWEIDIAILTHPHADHFMGFHFVKDRYKIKLFATEELANKTPAFERLMQKLTEEKIAQRFLFAGDKWQMSDGVQILIAGPTQAFLDSTSPGGTIGETKEFASIVSLVSYKNFTALLTGDSQASGLEQAYELIGKPVSILQSPHHGSGTGLSSELIEKLAPKMAVISVGKNNYGHPNLQTLYLLKDIPIKRTDKDGDVELSF